MHFLIFEQEKNYFMKRACSKNTNSNEDIFLSSIRPGKTKKITNEKPNIMFYNSFMIDL